MDADVRDAISMLADALKSNDSTDKNEKNEETSDQTGINDTTGANKNDAVDEKRERTFTQEEVNRMMSREKHQGKNAVYKELGIDPNDTSLIQMFKAFVNAQKTDKEKTAEADAKNKQEMTDMSNKLKHAEAKATLMQAGVSADYVDDAVIIALSKVSGDENPDFESIAKDLKTKYPVWFGSVKVDKPKESTGKRGTGATSLNGGNNASSKDTISGIGKRLAETRKAHMPKSSFWGD